MNKPRMYEPWGYQDENNYQGADIILENDLDSFFAEVTYDRDDNKIHFANKDGEEKATIDVSEFIKSDLIVEKAWYEDGKIHIKFTNGDEITVDVKELLDENEFKDGLQVVDGQVSVLIDGESDDYLSVGESGVKVAGVKADIEAEEARATAAEEALDAKIEAEIERATSAETALDAKIDQEIADREADVDEEEIRAKAAETELKNTIGSGFSTASTETVTAKFNNLSSRLDVEVDNRTTQDNQLQNNINTESTARQGADTRLENLITDEKTRAEAAETSLRNDLDAEITRSTTKDEELEASIAEEANLRASKDTELEGMINNEVTAREAADEALNALISGLDESKANKAEAVVSAEYVSGEKKINFKDISGTVISSIDASDFVVDGMVKDVKIENGKLIIDFNTDSGIEDIEIPLTDIFNPDNYYDKDAIDAKITALENADTALQGNITAEATARADKDTELNTKINVEIEARIGANEAQDAIIAQKADSSAVTADIAAATADMATKTWVGEQGYLTEHQDISNLATKDEVDEKIESAKTEYYTKEEVDVLLAEKETEITQIKKDYNTLKEIVGELGGNVEWGVPADGTFNNMMKKSGTVKLGEDITTSTYTGGITSKNETTLHLNGKNLTFSGQTKNNPGIMTRGEQKLTIMGKGTFDADGRIAVEANGADCEITLSGTMFGRPTYVTDRSGGELIYCYLGTINITEGIFKNLGEDKTFLLNCYDANYQNGTAKIIVTGGKFYDFNPADNSAEGEHTNFLAEGYHVETSTVTEEGVEHTIYTVKKDA